MTKLIADSGSTKCEWCLINNGKKKTIYTQGISPYFLSKDDIIVLIQKELLPKLKNVVVDEIYYYGTGLGNINNVKTIKLALKKVFPTTKIEAENDLLAIMTTGAYGAVMASNYNGRLKPAEILIKENQVFVIKEREDFDSLIKNEKLIN